MSATIIIECPKCGTKYNVIEQAIKPRGRTVHCTKCLNKWHVEPVESIVQEWEDRFKPDPIIEATAEREEADPEAIEHEAEVEEADEGPPQTIDRLGGPRPDSDFIAATPQIVSDPDDGHGSKKASLGLLAACIVLLISGAVGCRSQIEHAFPASARLYAVAGLDGSVPGQGLEIRDVHASLVTDAGAQTLTIQAKVVNPQKTTLAVPILHATLISDAPAGSKEAPTVRHWTLDPGTSQLAPQATANVKASFDGSNTENGKILLTFSADNNPQGK